MYNKFKKVICFALIYFINKKTFEIKDELEEYIYCDFEISKIISELNKKGFKTLYSCAGHNEIGLMWPTHKLPISEYESYKERSKIDKSLHLVKKEKEYFYHKDEKTSTWIYISFSKNYNFHSIPLGFEYQLVNGNSYISKKIDFYFDDAHTIRKSDSQIDEELFLSRCELEKWVKTL